MSVDQETRTPRPWPENAEPTDQQLADWLAVCTPTERLDWVHASLRDTDRAWRCALNGHDEQLALIDHTPGVGRHRGPGRHRADDDPR